jgi:hypothetical protein
MKVYVESCTGSGFGYTFCHRLTIRATGVRFKTSSTEHGEFNLTEALNLLEAEGYKRRNIRFIHH